MTTEPSAQPTHDRVSVVALRTVSGTQIQIQQTNAESFGHGYRLAGGRHYNQPTTTLVERDLDADDAREIRAMLDAVFPVAAAPDALPVPAVGDRWHCTTDTGTRVVTVTRVWDTEDAKGGTAVAFDWRDSDGGEYGSALGLPVFLGTYRPEQQPEAAPAPVLSDAERQFLKWTLDLAAEQMASCGDEFDADDEVALASLRRLAGGEQA